MNSPELPLAVRLALGELKRGVADLYGERFQRLYLYGSYARGAAHEESDVDVLVVLNGEVKLGGEITRMSPVVSDICLRYNLLISTLPVSAEWLRSQRMPFFVSVRQEAIPL